MKAMEHTAVFSENLKKRMVSLFVISVFCFLMTGCTKQEQIPADEVTTTAVEAKAIPAWVPDDTDPSIRFYFIADMGIYYDAFVGSYVYWNGNYWIYSSGLPYGYVYADLFNCNIVFLGVGVTYPWHRHAFYVSTYPIYFFTGPAYYTYGRGWRFYNENGRKFFSPHKNIKYNIHYNIHKYKGNGDKQKRDLFKTPEGNKIKQDFPKGGKQYKDAEKINNRYRNQPDMKRNDKRNLNQRGEQKIKHNTGKQESSGGKRK